jgi:hypothetical protein
MILQASSEHRWDTEYPQPASVAEHRSWNWVAQSFQLAGDPDGRLY